MKACLYNKNLIVVSQIKYVLKLLTFFNAEKLIFDITRRFTIRLDTRLFGMKLIFKEAFVAR